MRLPSKAVGYCDIVVLPDGQVGGKGMCVTPPYAPGFSHFPTASSSHHTVRKAYVRGWSPYIQLHASGTAVQCWLKRGGPWSLEGELADGQTSGRGEVDQSEALVGQVLGPVGDYCTTCVVREPPGRSLGVTVMIRCIRLTTCFISLSPSDMGLGDLAIQV
jgi:hypothetical protein